MVVIKKKIPIIILTKDEPVFLEAMVSSIYCRTDYPFKLILVDNSSKMNAQKTCLDRLINAYNLDVVYNKNNDWIMGFNLGIQLAKKDTSLNKDFIVLSDGDILVPLRRKGVCWLSYLMEQLNLNPVVGKIGLSLDITGIKNKPEFNKTYRREKKYMKGPLIGELIIAPVDTTIALYRSNFFVMDSFKMLPGHASLSRPYYYITRTSNLYRCKHLGWRYYGEPDINQVKVKLFCFTKYCGYIDPLILNKAPRVYKIYYMFFGGFYKFYWGGLVSFHYLKYIVKRFPRKINEIQNSLR